MGRGMGVWVDGWVGGWMDGRSSQGIFSSLCLYLILLFPLLHSHSAQNSQVFCRCHRGPSMASRTRFTALHRLEYIMKSSMVFRLAQPKAWRDELFLSAFPIPSSAGPQLTPLSSLPAQAASTSV